MDTLNTAAALPQSQSLISRIVGIFTSPRATMEDVVARPSWILPLLIIVITLGLSGYFLTDLIVGQELGKMERDGRMTSEQMNAAEPWIRSMSVIGPAIFVPIVYLILAGIFIFVGNVILGGEAKYKTALSVLSWSGLITILGSIVNVPLMLSRDDMTSPTSLAFLAGEDKESALFFLLSQIDLFSIWWLIIVGIGFAATYKFTNQKGMVTVFACWAVFIALGMGFKAIF